MDSIFALPSDLLVNIFRLLDYTDISNCMYTCWTGYNALYGMKNEKIFIRHMSELRSLIRCVEQSGQQQLDSNPRAVRPPFGTLIKVLVLHFRLDHEIQLGYVLLKLSRLAFLTPNIHTLRIDNAYGPHGIKYAQPPQRIRYDWEVELSCKWPKLGDLMLTEYKREAELIQHINTEIMLQRLHTLDILLYPDFTSILPPIMPLLQSLKISIETEESLQHLMTILENCGRSLHTLVINTCGPHDHLDDTHFNLDEIMKRVPNLKAFGFAYESGRPLKINSLPSQLEELEVDANNDDLFNSEAARDRNFSPDDVRSLNVQFERELENTESEGLGIPTLRKFRMDFFVFDCYMLKILTANKDTLEELVIGEDLGYSEIAMLMLQEKHVRMEKVVNLSFFGPNFINETSLLETKAVFPHVEVIRMAYSYQEPANWDVSKALGIWFSTLPYLKEVHVTVGYSTKVYKLSMIETRRMHTLFRR